MQTRHLVFIIAVIVGIVILNANKSETIQPIQPIQPKQPIQPIQPTQISRSVVAAAPLDVTKTKFNPKPVQPTSTHIITQQQLTIRHYPIIGRNIVRPTSQRFAQLPPLHEGAVKYPPHEYASTLQPNLSQLKYGISSQSRNPKDPRPQLHPTNAEAASGSYIPKLPPLR